MVLGRLERSHFATIEEFMSHEWLEEGATDLQQRIDRAVTEGIIDSRPENSAHPLHVLWYKFIWGRSLPSDLMFARDSQINRALHQMHRFLTLEYLLGRLLADWTDSIKDDVRAKLKNAP